MTTQNKDTIDPATHDYSKDPRVAAAKQSASLHKDRQRESDKERETIKAQLRKEILKEHEANRIEALKKMLRPQVETELRQEGKLGAFV